MAKQSVRSLQPIPIDITDMSSLWWDERTKVSMMTDVHLDNAIMKLARYGYDSPTELQDKWAEILRKESYKRFQERKATFNGKIMEPVPDPVKGYSGND